MNRRLVLLAGVLCGVGLWMPGRALPVETAAAVRGTWWSEAPGSLHPGAPGNLALEASVLSAFAESGFPHGALAFDTPVFIPGPAHLQLPDGDTVRLLPMHPTLMRPGNFPEDVFATRLVYLGEGRPEDLERARGIPLENSLVVMEFRCGTRWMDVLRFGVKGFVFLSANHYQTADAVAKVFNTEVSVPRYFAPAPETAVLRRHLEENPHPEVTVSAIPSHWQTQTLRNPWVLVPGSDPDVTRDVILMTAPIDANSIVPELASGGDAAGNVMLMLDMLDAWRQTPPKRSVLLVAVNAHTQGYLGERILAWHLLSDLRQVSELRDNMAREMRVASVFGAHYRRLRLEPVALMPDVLDTVMDLLWALHRIEPLETLDGIEAARLDKAFDAAVKRIADRQRGFIAAMTLTSEDRAYAADQIRRLEDLRQAGRPELDGLLAEAFSTFLDEQLLEGWRTEMDNSIGVRLAVKSRLQETVQRELNIVKLELMDLSRRDSGVTEDDLEALRELRGRLTNLLVLFNKIDVGRGRSRVRYRMIAARPETRQLLLKYRDRLVDGLAASAEQFHTMLEQDSGNGALRTVLGTHRVRLALTLGVDWSEIRFGFFALNPLPRNEWYRRLGALALRVADERGLLASHDGLSVYVDALSGAGGVIQESVFVDNRSPAGLFQAAGGVPSLALQSAYVKRLRAFTPRNRLEDLDPVAMQHRLQRARDFLAALVDTPGLTDRDVCPELTVTYNDQLWSGLIRTFEMDEFAAQPTPSLPIPYALIAAYSTRLAGSGALPSVVDGDVINAFTGMADHSGHAVLYGLSESPLAPIAYKLDDRFSAVKATIDKGRIQQPGQNDSNLFRTSLKTFPLFSVAEFVIADRVDSSLVGTAPILVQEFWPISADSLSDPAKYGAHGAKTLSRVAAHLSTGPIGIYHEFKPRRTAGEPLILLTGSKRFAVNASEEEPEGIGFGATGMLGADYFRQAAKDMDYVTRDRVANMPGIVNELVDEFLDRGRAALHAATEAAARWDYTAYRRQVALAIGNQVKAYDEVSSMNADMLKAIMVYMALMLPFCFFLQKLIFTFNKIEHEIGMFVLFFILTYAGFRLIHPAFAIAMSPEAIFLAFVLGTLGCFVTWMLHNRFSGEMDMLFRGMSGYMGEAAAGFVGQTAMLIGVGNMKRRRTRTALTTATVILVVFTMLAFSSVSRKARPTLVQLSPEAPYTGLFFTWPGGESMDEHTPRVFEAMFAGNAEILVRRVLMPEGGPAGSVVRWNIARVDRPDLQAGITAGMSLSSREFWFVGALPMLYGREFTADDADEIIVPATLAEALGLEADDLSNVRVRFMGRELTVVGILDDDRYRMLRDLDPRFPLLPRTGGGAPADAKEAADDTVMDVGDGVFDLSGMVFLPPDVCQSLGGRPMSVSVLLEEEATGTQGGGVWHEADSLLRATRAAFCMGSTRPFRIGDDARRTTDGGVYRVAGAYRTSIGGLARLVVPLLIAGLILFNTMLGTVYERKSEIAIYNAIGLNPHHIFTFFLAEALVYGVIGAIGGYLIGQILAMVAQTFDLVQGMNVNFSSLMVVWAILFTVALVLLSTIYPAFVATRAAVPSGTRRWALPPHDGQVMHVDMPFIYEPGLVAGVMAYLHEHFASCSKEGLGDMLVEVRALAKEPGEGHPVYRSEYGVALAPFDLGVTQAVCLHAAFKPSLESYHLTLSIRRESGQDSSWAAVNQPLLERLRKMLLRWRNMDPARREEYCVMGRQCFEE